MATSYIGQFLSQLGGSLPTLLNQRKNDSIALVQQQRKNTLEDEDRKAAKEQASKQAVLDEIIKGLKERDLKNANYEDAQRDTGDKAVDEFITSKSISSLPISLEYGMRGTTAPTSIMEKPMLKPGMDDMERASKFRLKEFSSFSPKANAVMSGIESEKKTADQLAKELAAREFEVAQQDKTFANDMEKEKYFQSQQNYRATHKPVGGGNHQQVIGYNEDGSPVYGASAQRLSQSTIKSLEEVKNFPALLNGLRSSIKTNGDVMGPIQGRLQSGLVKAGIVTTGSKKAAELNGRYEAVKQVVAKGMEGGVLRAEDMPKYEKIFGSIKLQPEFAEQNLDNLEQMLGDNYNSHLDGLKASGYEVPDNFYTKKDDKSTGAHQVSSDVEYNKLPSGTEFIGPDGKKRRKP